jgi:hypothetical protein
MLICMKRMNPKGIFQRMALQMRYLAAILAPLALCTTVLAGAPQPSLTRAPSPLIGFGLMFLMVVVVVVISFIPSKRSHQD